MLKRPGRCYRADTFLPLLEPTDPAAFLGEFFPASARGRYAGREIGFSFETDTLTTSGTFSEIGFERNGVVFLED
jgi:hypothetical protein